MTCSKIPYLSKADALDHAQQLKVVSRGRTRKKDYKKLRAYQCPNCLLWHLTTAHQYAKSKKRQRALRKL